MTYRDGDMKFMACISRHISLRVVRGDKGCEDLGAETYLQYVEHSTRAQRSYFVEF